MKKFAWVCAAVLVLAAFAPAAVDLGFGIKAGLSSSNVRWSDDDGTESALLKPAFGAFLTFNLTRTIAIQPEFWYVTLGEYWNYMVGSDSWKETWEENFLHIPVLLKARLATKGRIAPYVFAGPSLGILLSAKNKHFVNGQFDFTSDIKDYHKSTDLGADLGLGAETAMGSVKLILEARYYLGLMNSTPDPLHTLKNNTLMVKIGFGFGASKQ